MQIAQIKKQIYSLLFMSAFSIMSYSETLPVQHFEAIDVDGDFNIQVKSGPHAAVEIPNLPDYVEADSNDNTLFLRMHIPPNAKYQCPPVTVYITLPYLLSINLAGNSSIMGRNIHSNYLTINTQDNSHVILDGVLGVNTIDASGDSSINLRWVNSQKLTIRGNGNSSISVAGVTGVSDIRLTDSATLDSRYLRSKTMFIETRGNSTADVIAIDDMYAFATEYGNIYYYKTPGYYLDSTEMSGNSLQLGYWN